MVTGMLIFEAVPGVLLGMFDASEEMLKLGIPALRIIAVHFPLAGVSIALGSVFQAFSKSMYSLVVSICRQLVVLIPAAWLLAQTGVVRNVWLAFPIAEVSSLIISVFFFRKLYNSTVRTMEETKK